MADVFSKRKRSEVMARIRGRGNKDTELALMKLLRTHDITGWRRQIIIRIKVQRPTPNVESSKLSIERWRFSRPFTVRPDFVFRKPRVALFVDGCFWHGCPKHATQPKNNAAFWRKKLGANKRRDALVTRTLRRAGWRVVRLWEHELRKGGARSQRGVPSRVIRRIRRAAG